MKKEVGKLKPPETFEEQHNLEILIVKNHQIISTVNTFAVYETMY